MTRTRAPRVLAVAKLERTGRVELIGYRMRGYGGRDDLLCLDLAGRGGERAGGCDAGLPGRAAGTLALGTGGVEMPRLAVGVVTDAVDAVELRYSRDGRTDVAKAVLLNVSPSLARDVGTEAFTYYIAELPSEATGAVAVGRDGDGDSIWRAAFTDE